MDLVRELPIALWGISSMRQKFSRYLIALGKGRGWPFARFCRRNLVKHLKIKGNDTTESVTLFLMYQAFL